MRRKIVFPVLIVVLFAVFLRIYSDKTDSDFVNSNTFGIKIIGHVVDVKQKDVNVFALEIRPLSANTQKEPFDCNFLITYRGILQNPWELLHSDISFFSVIERPSPARNPNCFNYRTFLKSKGIGFIGTIKNYKFVSSGRQNLFEKIDIWLSKLRWKFQRNIPEQARGVIMGILFGDTYYMDDDTIDVFRKNGTAHVLTVSGLHVGIFFSLYRSISKRHKQSKLLKFVFVVILLFYGALSSWSPSVVRSVIMILLGMLGTSFDLRYDMFSSLCFVALLSIIKNPYVIYNPSFQMSFIAVTSIASLMPVMSKKIPESIRVCMAANLGLLLYQMYQFNYISLISVAANIPVILLIEYILPISMIYFLLVSFANGYMVECLSPIFEGLSIMLIKVNDWTTIGGFRGIDVISPPLFYCFVFGAGIFFFSSETFQILKSRRKTKTIIFIVVLSLVSMALISENFKSPISKDDIVFIDVGQGNSMHIRIGGSNVLIDGGGMAEYMSYNVGENTLKPYFLKNGVNKVDLAIATHKHTDHYKGIEELNNCFKIVEIRSELTKGNYIDMGKNAYIEVLWPLEIDDRYGQDDNSRCSVFMLNYEGIKILIPGDLDETGEKQMCDYYRGTGKLKADVLQVGHHGSRFSTTDEFLDEVSPQYAIIQVGKNNYGHPAPLVIEKLVKKGIMIYRNDRDGAVGLSIKDGIMEFHKMIG